jgi:hypothetical protein
MAELRTHSHGMVDERTHPPGANELARDRRHARSEAPGAAARRIPANVLLMGMGGIACALSEQSGIALREPAHTPGRDTFGEVLKEAHRTRFASSDASNSAKSPSRFTTPIPLGSFAKRAGSPPLTTVFTPRVSMARIIASRR